ncbi:ATP-binding protein [Streptacidiphilus melanogenes]|uniref:ATP-binding protein n=1 Tax=Streptacidiphilus melanogenes TaxID=411235 RepID=UPI000694B256|nr:ATP-binding protein [Streptacidiphilus melanogenes]
MSSTPAPNLSSYFHRRIFFPATGRRRLAVTEGMEFVRHALAEWHLGLAEIGGDHERADDAMLVATELLDNAEQHGGGARELRLDLDPVGRRLRITVADAAPHHLPQPVLPHRPEQPRGHGLHILTRLSTWGSTQHHGGKAVWAEVPVRIPRYGRIDR